MTEKTRLSPFSWNAKPKSSLVMKAKQSLSSILFQNEKERDVWESILELSGNLSLDEKTLPDFEELKAVFGLEEVVRSKIIRNAFNEASIAIAENKSLTVPYLLEKHSLATSVWNYGEMKLAEAKTLGAEGKSKECFDALGEYYSLLADYENARRGFGRRGLEQVGFTDKKFFDMYHQKRSNSDDMAHCVESVMSLLMSMDLVEKGGKLYHRFEAALSMGKFDVAYFTLLRMNLDFAMRKIFERNGREWRYRAYLDFLGTLRHDDDFLKSERLANLDNIALSTKDFGQFSTEAMVRLRNIADKI